MGVKDGVWKMVWQRWCVTKLYVKDGMWQRWCVTKLYVKDVMWMVCDKDGCERWCVKDGMWQRWCVTKLYVKDGMWQRWCVTKLYVKDGMWQRWYVTDGVWKMVRDKDGVWQAGGGRREEAGGGRREATRDTESKTRTPHKVVGQTNNGCTGIKQTFTWPKTRFYPGITGQPGQLMYLLVPLATWWSAS